jgi:ADP-ribose pyrophosphatase YjhB (NUDIX family)
VSKNENKYDSGRELIARVVIVQNDCILVNQGKSKKTGETYFALPGGHVDPGESCVEAARREVQEELEAEIQVGDLLCAAEQIYAGQSKSDGDRHELTLLFTATLTKAPREANGKVLSPEPSKNFQWLPLSQLPNANLLPPSLKRFLLEQNSSRYDFHDATKDDTL